MRELTVDELEMISGGGSDGEDVIVVIGNPGGGGGGGGGGVSVSPNPGTGGGTGGGSGGSTPAYAALDALNPTEEAAADALTIDFRQQIMSDITHDYFTQEANAPILQMKDGTIKLGPISWGPVGGGIATINYGPDGADVRQVIGIVHQHPLGTTQGEAHFVASLRPSEHVGGDRSEATRIINAGGNAAAFRHYIIGPDSVIRQYNYNSPVGQTSSDVVG